MEYSKYSSWYVQSTIQNSLLASPYLEHVVYTPPHPPPRLMPNRLIDRRLVDTWNVLLIVRAFFSATSCFAVGDSGDIYI